MLDWNSGTAATAAVLTVELVSWPSLSDSTSSSESTHSTVAAHRSIQHTTLLSLIRMQPGPCRRNVEVPGVLAFFCPMYVGKRREISYQTSHHLSRWIHWRASYQRKTTVSVVSFTPNNLAGRKYRMRHHIGRVPPPFFFFFLITVFSLETVNALHSPRV
ncbi:hypothetical protein PAXRUDRAFT_416115 [Paxillus rubicundulus Ve08.2h10]|uniref:Uncharacterized protein n=1 Tax=Paxillus rubicundulus Ve08.2h10 TaxID=930991 RepID=A0A0D0DCN2_9AGAM|nr:hypothetical protein PAXRUDRAFT_416115 [Paxillus rubicundulus Ve08.2h10]